ncbi:MAG: nucleotide sugar dehydrogenase, partial [Candidatus Helarchaeota archaeon]
FAKRGATVFGVDVQETVIKSVQNGISHIDEPGLDDLLKFCLQKNNFSPTLDYKTVMKQADIFIICVPTPITPDKTPDYSNIIDVCNTGMKFLKKEDLIIIESTISPRVIDDLIIPLIEKNTRLKGGVDYGIASCPERANPGTILENFNSVPRIIGGYTTEAAKIATAIYRFATDAKLIVVSNSQTACAVKLTENIFRDVNIALANELAILYEKLGLDIIEIIEAASTKWNFQPHYPGAGVGGPCLPANPYYLIREAIKVGYVPHLIRMAREINDRMPQHIVDLTLRGLNHAGKSLNNAQITILGITYKPQVCDYQLSPAFPIIQTLLNLGAHIKVYDPLVNLTEIPNWQFSKKVFFSQDLIKSITHADCLILITAHEEFKHINFDKIIQYTTKPLVIIDGRNVYNPNQLPAEIIYIGVGRKVHLKRI